MRKNKFLFNKSGSTLIELLIATFIVGSIVVATTILMTYSLKNTSESRYRELASTLAQDAIEVYRQKREVLGWKQFVTLYPDNTIKCLDEDLNEEDSCSAFLKSKTLFKREIKFIGSPRPPAAPNVMKIVVKVTWNVGASNEQSIEVTQVLNERN